MSRFWGVLDITHVISGLRTFLRIFRLLTTAENTGKYRYLGHFSTWGWTFLEPEKSFEAETWYVGRIESVLADI